MADSERGKVEIKNPSELEFKENVPSESTLGRRLFVDGLCGRFYSDVYHWWAE